MKIFITSLFLITAFATFAIGADYNYHPFELYSGASGAVKTSTAYPVAGYKLKTMVVSGSTAAGVFKNMSGTAIVQCAPTKSGPWSTCVANDYAQTAVSRTTDGTMTWADAIQYIRMKWTAGTVKTYLKSYLQWVE